ncbi:MAG: hypothetical protein AABZ06_05320 [Bdellovibrionota bacterium]
MALTAFDEVPRARFFGRAVWLYMIAAVMGFVLIGFFAEDNVINIYYSLATGIKNIPAICIAGDFVNEFQKLKCEETWQKLFTLFCWACVPFVIGFVIFLLANDSLVRLYRDGQRRVISILNSGQHGAAPLIGSVTDPPTGGHDFFSWLYCFMPITVELPNGSQVDVLIPCGVQAPTPGSALVVFEIGKRLGKQRYLAAPYTPHIVVFSGSRK